MERPAGSATDPVRSLRLKIFSRPAGHGPKQGRRLLAEISLQINKLTTALRYRAIGTVEARLNSTLYSAGQTPRNERAGLLAVAAPYCRKRLQSASRARWQKVSAKPPSCPPRHRASRDNIRALIARIRFESTFRSTSVISQESHQRTTIG